MLKASVKIRDNFAERPMDGLAATCVSIGITSPTVNYNRAIKTVMWLLPNPLLLQLAE